MPSLIVLFCAEALHGFNPLAFQNAILPALFLGPPVSFVVRAYWVPELQPVVRRNSSFSPTAYACPTGVSAFDEVRQPPSRWRF